LDPDEQKIRMARSSNMLISMLGWCLETTTTRRKTDEAT
jgi:hypothetical protein